MRSGIPSVRLQADGDARSVRLQADQSTVREWLVRHGQTPRVIELLWEPLAVAALNQSIDEASGAVFAGVLSRMFTKDRRDSALGLPLKALDELYANPARAYVERAGGTVRVNAPARVVCGTPLTVRVRDEEIPARVAARPPGTRSSRCFPIGPRRWPPCSTRRRPRPRLPS
jgi:predicted NAD/FAD-binding protein